MTDTSLNPSRFNKVGSSGNRGSDNNIVDSYLQTFEFGLTFQAGAMFFDTGIELPNIVQTSNAFIIVDTPESTGLTKNIQVGVSGKTDAFLGSTDVSAVGPIGTPLFTVTEVPVVPDKSILITYGSTDWEEFSGRVILQLLCIRE